jgi:hypothetical protein
MDISLDLNFGIIAKIAIYPLDTRKGETLLE